MWFRNHLVNPVVRWLLRSPLHPLFTGNLRQPTRVRLRLQGRDRRAPPPPAATPRPWPPACATTWPATLGSRALVSRAARKSE